MLNNNHITVNIPSTNGHDPEHFKLHQTHYDAENGIYDFSHSLRDPTEETLHEKGASQNMGAFVAATGGGSAALGIASYLDQMYNAATTGLMGFGARAGWYAGIRLITSTKAIADSARDQAHRLNNAFWSFAGAAAFVPQILEGIHHGEHTGNYLNAHMASGVPTTAGYALLGVKNALDYMHHSDSPALQTIAAKLDTPGAHAALSTLPGVLFLAKPAALATEVAHMNSTLSATLMGASAALFTYGAHVKLSHAHIYEKLGKAASTTWNNARSSLQRAFLAGMMHFHPQPALAPATHTTTAHQGTPARLNFEP